MRLLIALAVSLLLTALAVASVAGATSPYLPSDEQQVWADQLASADERIHRAQQRAEAAEAAYSEARHARYPRGEELAEIERERAAAEQELRDAREAMERLLGQARQAGVLPEVLRPYRYR